jgi:hypothetical protein
MDSGGACGSGGNSALGDALDGGSGAGAAGILHDDPKPSDDVDPSAGMG